MKWTAFRAQDYGYTKFKAYNKTHIVIEQVPTYLTIIIRQPYLAALFDANRSGSDAVKENIPRKAACPSYMCRKRFKVRFKSFHQRSVSHFRAAM